MFHTKHTYSRRKDSILKNFKTSVQRMLICANKKTKIMKEKYPYSDEMIERTNKTNF